MAFYKINSVRLSDLGAVGDTIELTDEELNNTQYSVYLQKVERSPSKKRQKKSVEASAGKGEDE